MRRSRQQLPADETINILKSATNGVLALVDPSGKPYAVPMSFIYDGEKHLFFHCAVAGRKFECIKNNPYACFTIIDQDEIHPELFTTFFRSVIVEGTIKILTDREEMVESLRMLSTKYSPGLDCEPEINKGIDRVVILKMGITSITGKEAIELTKKRNNLLYSGQV